MNPALPRGSWKVQPARSRVGFRVKHLGVSSAEGHFESFAGTLDVSPASIAARGAVEVASIRTGDSQRDSLLASRLFFDAGHHAEITFASSAAEPLGHDRVRIEGTLTIRGTSNPLRLEARVLDQGRDALKLAAAGEISRGAYGLRFRGPMSAGNRAVADRVSIDLEIVLAAH